jgi:hypothetical protein
MITVTEVVRGVATETDGGVFWLYDEVMYRPDRVHQLYRERGGQRWAIDCWSISTRSWLWTVLFIPHDVLTYRYQRGKFMASKWLTAATVVAECKTAVAAASDPALFKARPAMFEFMSELEASPGVPRELSILMVALTDQGVRCGLKEEAVGGWLWRTGVTLSAALDAIEASLQSGKPDWSIPKMKPAPRRVNR